MSLALGDKIVEWAIDALKSYASLPNGLQVVPFVSGAEAQTERVVMKVEVGEQYLEADQGYNATMTLTYKTADRDDANPNTKWGMIENAIFAGFQTSGANAKAILIFSRLDFLTENATTAVENTANFRHYTRTIPMHAKLL